MKAFATLYETLDSTTSINDKVAAMVSYFRESTPEDAAWALFFLSGHRLKRFISSRLLTLWFLEAADISEWLFEECYVAVGDTAETIALLNDSLGPKTIEFDSSAESDVTLAGWMNDKVRRLESASEEEQKNTVIGWWKRLPQNEVFILNKLLTGAFRVGVSQKLLVRALAELSGLGQSVIAHRMMGHWEPTGLFYQELMMTEYAESDVSRPYPFFLAYPLEQEPDSLGPVSDWQIEWKWDGIRAQIIQRNDQVFVWSRGEELLAGRFPELEEAAFRLPAGTVLDGEILCHNGDAPLPFSVLQTRIGRKSVSKKLLADAPAAFIVYDILEYNERDVRQEPLSERRNLLADALQSVDFPVLMSPTLQVHSWEEAAHVRQESRARQVEGFILKRLDSTYQSGRKKGDWWKWKIDPYSVDAVLIYAQAGTGRRANLYTDYTFAVWNNDQLVPIAKAYSGLSNVEIDRLDRWIRSNTLEKFGPVRSVTPHHVFELAFEGISESKRHKSGVAVRFPRILRWREDKPMQEADTLDYLKGLIHVS
ncbi:MAG: ATP-dependent ligase [Vampirovibrio sp.]|jgi:DNA ligase-1|nr:ATP-dependent ligase [Vampirovibrio sp.]